ncbi:hypothetical protein [Devosia elaeis]|uniref:hypothetical protein n=1 Tax=Devosia elaeis TaxID=1770058 RepID=UPI000A53A6AA|nr:hypothetical protein [Devosia elaeis]
MGKLLKFAGRKTTASDGNTTRGSAQILIFTGVRYERGTPPPSDSHAETKRRKRKRG